MKSTMETISRSTVIARCVAISMRLTNQTSSRNPQLLALAGSAFTPALERIRQADRSKIMHAVLTFKLSGAQSLGIG